MHGQTVIVNAKVVAATAPSGKVRLKDGSRIVAEDPIIDGAATFTMSSLAPGSHILTAYYTGDIGHFASASKQMELIVSSINRVPGRTFSK